MWQSKREFNHCYDDVKETHRALFVAVQNSFLSAFQAMQRSLIDLEIQMQLKLNEMRKRQETILQTQRNCTSFDEFNENVKKIYRTLDTFTAHADNLYHIKLTLNRAAQFVTPDGNLALLVNFFFVFVCFFLVKQFFFV